LGNTLVSLFSYVHGDISPKYILGIPQGWSLGRGAVFFFWVWMGRTMSSPAINVLNPKGFRFYVRSVDRLCSADHQVAPSGVIDPLSTSPEILPGLLAYVSCILELPPQVGSWAAYHQACRLLPPQVGSWAAYHRACRLLPLRRWHPTRYQCTWLLARYPPKIPPKIPATGIMEAA
jgi:hypothetical protein